MTESTEYHTEYQKLIKGFQAVFSLYHAINENEVMQAINSSLASTQFVTVYYKLIDNELDLITSYDPKENGFVEAAPDHFYFTDSAFFSTEFQFQHLEESQFPLILKNFFAKQGCEKVASFPIKMNGTLSGLLLAGSRAGQLINSEIIEPLIQLAKAAPFVSKNLISIQNTDRRLLELETIAETSQLISLSNDLESIFKILHTKIKETIGTVDFAIALYNPLTKTIELPYVSENGVIKSIDSFPLGEGVISVLLRTRQPLMLVEDAERHLSALGAKNIGKPAKSWLGCPLNVANGTIGALVIQDLEKENLFDQDDLRLMIALSNQAAGAINTIRLLEDTRRKAIELQTVAEISREVSSSLIIDDLLQKAVGLLHDRFNFHHAAVYLLDSGGENAIIREATGEIGKQLKRSGHKITVGSKSVIGFVTEQKELLVINDTSKDPTYSANPLLSDTKAEACFPLIVSDRILGTLDVHSLRPYLFTEENIRVLQILADQLAVAVVNSSLFSDAQERLSQHRLLHHVTTAAASSTTIQEALNSAVQGLQVTLGGDQISIMMADKEQKNLEVRASIGYPNEESARLKIPFGVGVTGWVAAHRRSLRISDTSKDSRYLSINPKVRSELAIPLVYRNEVLGVLNLESARLNAYSENDEEMLGTLAGSLAAIIAHSQLLEQYRQQVERERLLSEITNKIRRTTNPGLILSIAADELSKTLNTRRTHVEIRLQNTGQSEYDEPDGNQIRNPRE
ncbi:MAG TPA: GAF domain-containing protein [Prolixibacteraceae bacterium]|jgi:GAF domain-containing protein